MQTWLITLHGPAGIVSTVDTGESQFVIGAETASDVFTVNGKGVMPRHAWVWISEAGLQVEDFAGGTLVNGYQINERVQVEYPASLQVGEMTLVIEVKALQPVDVSPTPSSLDITIPQRVVTKSNTSSDVAILQRAPTRGTAQKAESTGTLLAQSSATDKASTLCEYTLVREIARGGMGQIYFGEDQRLEREVAVKVSSISEDGEDARFSKEAKVLAQLAHPNIVPIYNIGIDAQGRPFYSMKLIKGRTLQGVLNLIRDGDAAAIKDYPRATLLTIFRKVCDAMMFAHSKGILHRDLKPENIMVGEYGEVLVMDWGLAKVLGEQESCGAGNAKVNDTGDYGMTIEGEVMGTPQYMSPEQAHGMVADLDQRSDIYSLGGILYAILTLRPPIEGTTLDEVLTKVKNGSISSMITRRGGKGPAAIDAPNAMGVEVPHALQAVTLKAMATDRDKRYSSVEALAGDIERHQNGFATQAEDAGAWKLIRLWVARNKVLAGSATAMLLVVGGFTGKVLSEGRRATRALRNLSELSPLVAKEAEESLREGKFEEGLARASYAVNLNDGIANSHAVLGNALQVCNRWEEAAAAYRKALQLGFNEVAKVNLSVVEELIALSKNSGVQAARLKLQAALAAQGREHESAEYSRVLKNQPVSGKDPEAGKMLIKQLNAELLSVPGTQVMMQKTEFTVGEWKLYVAAQGLPAWEGPETKIRTLVAKQDMRFNIDPFSQTDDHPLVFVSWDQARDLCRWLTKETGKEWRLPREQEWLAAIADQVSVGISKDGQPQGNVYIGQERSAKKGIPSAKAAQVGIAGVYGTMPVGSFKANVLGFHDLGGNVWEFMWDGALEPGKHVLRGGGWRVSCEKVVMKK
jgi:serine/threonine protein kinase/formylglycine-generating enzyme required for sulfatase activity